MGWRSAGEFLFPASHLLVAEPERLDGQLRAVAMAGKAIALEGHIEESLVEEANKEYIDDPANVLEGMTRMILEMRKERAATSP